MLLVMLICRGHQACRDGHRESTQHFYERSGYSNTVFQSRDDMSGYY